VADTAVVSKSTALKGDVLERIKELGGVVSGSRLDDVHHALGYHETTVSRNTLSSALWKLVDEGALKFTGERDWNGDGDPRGVPSIIMRTYTLR